MTDDFKTSKDETFFRKIIEKLGAKPSECIMVGDKEASDIQPAKAVGMTTVRVLQGKEKNIPSNADYKITKIEEMLEIMQ